MTIMTIDVEATDSDGNVASGSVEVLVNDPAAALSAGDELTEQERRAHLLAEEGEDQAHLLGLPLMRSTSVTNEAINHKLTVAAKPVLVPQNQKSHTIAMFTGGYR